MSTFTWIQRSGQSHDSRPHEVQPIASMVADITSSTTLAVAEASLSLGTVRSLASANTAAVSLRSESMASSAIGGSETSSRLAFGAEVAFEGAPSDLNASRVARNGNALRDALETSAPARTVDYLRWHRLLAVGPPQVRANRLNANRTEQNWNAGRPTGSRNASIQEPPSQSTAHLMDDLDRFAMRTDLAPLVHAAIVHAQFEVIQPFVTDNDLVGRVMLQHHLTSRLDLTTPIPISVQWYRDMSSYFEGLHAYQNGDFDPWIEFTALSVVQTVDWMHRSSEATSSLLGSLRSQATIRPGSVAARVIDDIPQHPIVDARTIAERYGVTRQTAYEALCRLSRQNILGEKAFARRIQTGRPRRVFSCPQFIDLLDDLSGL